MSKSKTVAFLASTGALCALSLKISFIASLFGFPFCSLCSPVPLVLPGMIYFFLFSLYITFSKSLSFTICYFGFVWSIGLMVVLTMLSPVWCMLCLIAHGMHVASWVSLSTHYFYSARISA